VLAVVVGSLGHELSWACGKSAAPGHWRVGARITLDHHLVWGRLGRDGVLELEVLVASAGCTAWLVWIWSLSDSTHLHFKLTLSVARRNRPSSRGRLDIFTVRSHLVWHHGDARRHGLSDHHSPLRAIACHDHVGVRLGAAASTGIERRLDHAALGLEVAHDVVLKETHIATHVNGSKVRTATAGTADHVWNATAACLEAAVRAWVTGIVRSLGRWIVVRAGQIIVLRGLRGLQDLLASFAHR
jgi:hypothetical protein